VGWPFLAGFGGALRQGVCAAVCARAWCAGQDIRTQNVTACLAIANIVKSTLGPIGLDKMMVREGVGGRVRALASTDVRPLRMPHCTAPPGVAPGWRAAACCNQTCDSMVYAPG
jgi:hypothetical protein